MPDDREDRRQQNLRDLEFYRQRVRPSATDLWRTLEKRRNTNDVTLSNREPAGRADGRLGLRTPSSMAEAQADFQSRSDRWESAEAGNSAVDSTGADAILPLVCALIVLAALAWTGNVDRIASAFPF
jgi:hypothetical protein